MKSLFFSFTFIVIGFFAQGQQQFSNSNGNKVMFFDEANEQAMYELIIDPTGYNCECDDFYHFFHKIDNTTYVTDDENVTLKFINANKIKIEVKDASYCCTVKAGIYY
jgi:hypothetical protein